MASEKQYLELFRARRDMIGDNSTGIMNALREEAAGKLEKLGLPSSKNERYKYTNAQEAFGPDYGINIKRLPTALNPQKTYNCSVPGLETEIYYVVNDIVYAGNPETSRSAGVEVMPLRKAAALYPELVGKHYGALANAEYDGVAALNTMLAQDGLFIHVAENAATTAPLQIVNISSAGIDMMSNRRILMVLERNARASVLLCDHSEEHHSYLTTQVVEVYAGEGAQADIYGIEETHPGNTRFNNLYVEQQAQSRVAINGITLLNGITRNTADIRLAGNGATVTASGAVMAGARERVDNNILVDHVAEGCDSEMLYKYVLDGHSVGAFAGRVLVRPGAQKSISNQTNANICASPEARAYSQPMLEIYADDVRCNHGSTVGKLDEQALLYMRQRGIEEAEAKLLLQHAFINEVLHNVGIEELRKHLSDLVEMRFRGQLSRCRCTACSHGCAKSYK